MTPLTDDFGNLLGYLTDDGLFITQRDTAPWLWDAWMSVEAHWLGHGLLVANARSKDHCLALLSEVVA